jgi:hypothetical protein
MNSRIRVARALAVCLCVIGLASCSLRLPVGSAPLARLTVSSPSAKPGEVAPRDPHVMVWLVADHHHSGVVLPYDWLIDSGFVPPVDFPSARYVAMSWGNRDAYSAQGIDNPWKWFRVLFTPTPSVMEMIPIRWEVTEVLPGQRIWRRLTPRERGPQVAAFLNRCLEHDVQGRPVVVASSSWGGGVQFQSSHSYFIPRVCNVWTAQVIEAMGGRIRPWRAVTANGLIRQAERPPNDFEQIWAGRPKQDETSR